MRIAKVRIESILGIDELEFTPAGFTEISGPNGTGKTSVLDAIKAVMQDGHDATLLRQGAEKGEVVLVLDDGTELKKRVSPKASPRSMHREGGKVPRPAEAIKALTDALSVNPVDFLRAPKKDRVRVLLEAMPIQVDGETLTRITGIPFGERESGHALEVIEGVRRAVYDDRTGTNRAAKEKAATINQLRSAMPDAPSVEGDEQSLTAELEAARQAQDNELERIRTKLEGFDRGWRQQEADIRTDAQARIDAIKAEAADKVAAIHAEEKKWREAAATQRERTIASFNAAAQPLNEALSQLRTNASALAKRQQAQETIDRLEAEAQALREDSERQTQALADLDAYKASLLADLPIPGVEVRDGELFRGGVPFDRLNTAQQVEIAVEIAKLRAGELAICCVDGLELLDPEAFEAFKARALESGLQLFVSRVSDGPFRIASDGESAQAPSMTTLAVEAQAEAEPEL